MSTDKFLRALEADLDQLAQAGQDAVAAEKAEFANLELGGLTREVIGAAFAALREQRDINTPEGRLIAELGALRARQGIPLHAMVYGFRRIATLGIGRSQALAEQHGVTPQTLYELFSRQWAWVIDALAIASEEHRRTELELLHHRQEKRVAFLHGLFTGTLATERLRAAATEHDLDPRHNYYVIRTAATDPDTRSRLSQIGFTESYEGGLAGLHTRPPAARAGELIAVSKPQPLPGAPLGFAQASTALAVGQAFGMTGCIAITDVPIQAAVMAEREMGAHVAERCFAALADQHRPLYQQTLATYLAHNLNAKTAAEALHLHPNTLRYRIRRFEEISGLRLTHVNDLVTIWWALQHLRATDASV